MKIRFNLILFSIFFIACSTTPKIVPYSDDSIPLEKQCQLAISPWITVYMFDEIGLEIPFWNGHINKLYNMPSGIHKLSFGYAQIGTYNTYTASGLSLTYDFLPGKIYLLKYRFVDDEIVCWIEETENLEKDWYKNN